MCEPTTIALTVAAISAASSVAASNQQNKIAEQQQAAIAAQAQSDQEQLALRNQQEKEAESDQLIQVRRAALVEQSQTAAAAANAGISGNSVNRIIRRQRAGQADATSSIVRQGEVTELQLGQQAEAIRRGADANINSVETVDTLTGTLRAVGAGAQAYFGAGGTIPTGGGGVKTVPAQADGFTQGPPRPIR